MISPVQLTVVQSSESRDRWLEIDKCCQVLRDSRQTNWGDESRVGQAGRQLQQSQVIVVVRGIIAGVHNSNGSGQLDEGRGQGIWSSTNDEGAVSLDAVGSSDNPIPGDQRATASNRGCSDGTTHPHMPRELASGCSCTANNTTLNGGILLGKDRRRKVLRRGTEGIAPLVTAATRDSLSRLLLLPFPVFLSAGEGVPKERWKKHSINHWISLTLKSAQVSASREQSTIKICFIFTFVEQEHTCCLVKDHRRVMVGRELAEGVLY